MKTVLKLFSRISLIIFIMMASESLIWGSSDKYYAKVTVHEPTGAGNVYVNNSETSSAYKNSESSDYVTSSGGTVEFYAYYVLSNSNYHFKKWLIGENTSSMGPLESERTQTDDPSRWDYTEIEYSVKASSTKDSGNAKQYYIQPLFLPNWYYAKLSATSSGHGSVSVASSPQYATSSGGNVTFQISATPESGYRLKKWTVTSGSGTFGNNTSANTTFNTTAASTYDEENATSYSINAEFELAQYTVSFICDNSQATGGPMADVYFTQGIDQKLPKNQFYYGVTVTFDASGGTIDGQETKDITSGSFSRWLGNDGVKYNDEQTINKTGISSLKLTTVWHKDDDGKYKAVFTPSTPVRGDRTCTGWHWSRWTVNKKADVGTSFWMTEKDDKTNSVLYAQWGDPFYANVNLSKTSGTSGSPSVDESEKYSDYKNADLVFTITAPAASDGYHFSGWTGTNVTFDDASKQTNAKATVKSSSTAGSANATVADIKANYAKNTYSIKINANGTANGERIVFNVSGLTNYRISVPIGGSATIFDVPFGSYTVSPENTWSWDSNVTPSSKSVSFNSSGGSQTVAADFTITSKGSAKKHDEASSTVTP